MDALDLDLLKSGNFPGLSKEIGAHHLQASLVCLDHNGHSSGSELRVKLNDEECLICRIFWSDAIDDQIRRSWADLTEATEYGASGIACLLIVKLTEFTICERSVKDTGFDYWLCEKGGTGTGIDQIFPHMARLEVSGLLCESRGNTVASRVKI